MAESVAEAGGTGGGVAVAMVVVVAVAVGRVSVMVMSVPATRVVRVPLAHVNPLPGVPGGGRVGAHGAIMCV